MKHTKAAFVLSLIGFSFAYGLIVGAYEVFPYRHLKYVLNSVETVIANRDSLTSDRPTAFLAERRYQGNGVTIHDPRRAHPGFTLLSGFFDDLPGIRLVDMHGNVVQSWPISFFTLFESTDHIFPKNDVPASDWNVGVHGIHISPDGSVVFNLDGKGTAKLDRCGKPIWLLHRMTHHSIEESKDGSYWIPSRHFVENESDAYPLFRTPYRDDTIMRVSPDGEILSEISLNKILIDNGLYALLVANGRFTTDMQEEDVLHVNDIDEMTEELAGSFPLFSAGDLVLSLRHLNMLMVIDPSNWQVKWYQSGPWLRQHDPDFQKDGTITLLNNNSDDTKDGELLGGSSVMSIQPHLPDRPVNILYGKKENEYFFTNTQGKHQVFDNGNILIVEYYGGRVLEVSPSGEIVWQYINEYDQESVARLSGAERYAEDYFNVKDWSCSAD
jgi:hypothetical protein